MAQEEVAKKQPKSFEALTPELSEWILSYTKGMGFARTTPVQAMAIPLLMGNRDLVVEAVTGSGKTLSFLIPLVSRILASEEPNKKGYVRSIVLAPTKELASQIYDVLTGLLKFHPPSAAAMEPVADSEDEEMTGGMPEVVRPAGPYIVPQLLIGGRSKLSEDLAAFSSQSPSVLIGTPKRMLEVLGSSKVIVKRHWFDLLVLDEADRLLDANFKDDLQRILEIVPKERRTGLFSASVSEAVNELVRVGMRYPFKISAKVRSKSGALDKRTPESLKLYHVITKPSMKLPILKKVLERNNAEKTIIYVSTRAGVDYWNHVLPVVLGQKVFPLHGDHKAAIRSTNLRRFRDTVTPAILLTTDVLARGIDIPDIDLVVQLDPPSQPKVFIHRCGRSGRAGKRGMAVTFLNEGSEADYVKYLELQGTPLEPLPDTPVVTRDETEETTRSIHDVLRQKRELHERSQKSFVSWVQAYSKTTPNDIFDMKNLDWLEVGKAWGLLRWPKMPELKRYFPSVVKARTFGLDLPEGFLLEDLAFADKVREQKRQEIVAALAKGDFSLIKGNAGGAAAELRRRTEKAWSGQKEAKAVREARRERKEVRRNAERKGKMSSTERAEDEELDGLIERVRKETRARREADEDVFEGFDD